MTRQHLPTRRLAENVDVRFQGMDVSVSFGWIFDPEDGWRIREVFASTRKVGTGTDTMVRDISVFIFLSLQHGMTPKLLERSLTMTETGEPEGFAGVIVRMIKERETEVRAEVAA